MRFKQYYECHVTVERPYNHSTREEYEALASDFNWKTSCIDGDPVLGKKIFFYFTTHNILYEDIYNKMEALAFSLGNAVIRKKIELIVYDSLSKQI